MLQAINAQTIIDDPWTQGIKPVIPPKLVLRGKPFRPAADGSFASMTTLPTPFAAYSKGPGLTELLRLYGCGLQPRPSVQLSSSRVIANH
jgi:hypothetical protein